MKKYVLITGSAGLIGSEAVEFFINKKFTVIGIDNNYRKFFFGKSGSVENKIIYLKKKYKNYKHYNVDLKNFQKVRNIFKKYNTKIKLIIHSAAQPSHDWAIINPLIDFDINARSTLNLLELFSKYASKSSFIFLSTNKVYGDRVNKLSYIEKKKRYELSKKISFHKKGINENFSIDHNVHSLFGVSKLSADLYVQEYGKNLNLNTVVFRGGCLTGKNHSGTEMHGFLAHLVKNVIKNKFYKIIGYKGKQVRDNIHSSDLVNCFWQYFKRPAKGVVYNIGGGRKNSCSILEVLDILEHKLGITIKKKFVTKCRTGDHKWWITDFSKFKKDYPQWKIKKTLDEIIDELIYSNNQK